MNVAVIATATSMMMHNQMMYHNQMMMQQELRRRREREEEQRRREEKQRKLVEYRKNAPVVYCDEEWQVDRCIKAISMQSCVQNLISAIEKAKPEIIKKEEQKYDEKLLKAGQKYNQIKNELDNDIENLRRLGITISGTKYKLSRLIDTNTNMALPEGTTEIFGNTFTINDEQPIELNTNILSTERYFEEKYEEMNPEELEQEFNEINSKVKKYQKYGKLLRFLLKTDKYLELEEELQNLIDKHEQCKLRKKEMESFKSLSKEQLLAIKSYFIHLDQLITISSKIKDILRSKGEVRDDNNEKIYDLAIKKALTEEEYSDEVAQTYDYIYKIHSNDEETMKEAYELVKGEYPINIPRKFIYDLIVNNKNYNDKDKKKTKRR